MFLFKRKCEHEYETVGLFYKEYLTEYRNCFDSISVYMRRRCKKCGDVYDARLSSETFVPELYHDRDERKDMYIDGLKEKGIGLEIDLYKK